MPATSRRRAARTQPGRSHQTKWPAPSTRSSRAPGMRSTDRARREVGGHGTAAHPRRQPSGVRIAPSPASSCGSRASEVVPEPDVRLGRHREGRARHDMRGVGEVGGPDEVPLLVLLRRCRGAVHVLGVELLDAGPRLRGQAGHDRGPERGRTTVADRPQRVDRQHAVQSVGDRLRDMETQVTTPRVPDEPGPLPAEMVEHGDDVIDRLGDGELPVRARRGQPALLEVADLELARQLVDERRRWSKPSPGPPWASRTGGPEPTT